MSSTKRRGLSSTSGVDAMASTKRKPPSGLASRGGVSKKQKPLPQDRTFFQDTLLFTHKRLGLSENAVTLLKYLDEVKLGGMDKDDLARKIRLSPAFYKALLDTVNWCSIMMVQRPLEGLERLQIIEKCTEMMEISRLPPPPGLPFFKFPREIRDRIYDLNIESQFRGQGRSIGHYPSIDPECLEYSCPPHTLTAPLNLSLLQTCSRIRDEIISTLYNTYTLSFNCSCTMSDFLDSNALAAANVRSLKFHWRGLTSATAISKLYRCPELKHLTVLVSKMTLYYGTEREERMNRFFHGNVTRMCDSNGIDELMGIRGLESISVKHAKEGVSNKVTRATVWSLQRLLEASVKNGKPEDYGQ